MSIITAEAFKQLAVQELQISPFPGTTEPITVQVKATGIMNLLSNGRIPNTLLNSVNELFNGKKREDLVDEHGNLKEEAKKAAEAGMANGAGDMAKMAELMKTFASETLVAPRYEEIADFMTDQQMQDIFEFMMGDMKTADSFRSQSGNANGTPNLTQVPPIA